MTEQASMDSLRPAGIHAGADYVVPGTNPLAEKLLGMAPNIATPVITSEMGLFGRFAVAERLHGFLADHPRLRRVAAVVLHGSQGEQPRSVIPIPDTHAQLIPRSVEVSVAPAIPMRADSELPRSSVHGEYHSAVSKVEAFLAEQFPKAQTSWKDAIDLHVPFEGYLVETGDPVVRRLPYVTMVRYYRDEDRLKNLAQAYSERGLSEAEQSEALNLVNELTRRNDAINVYMLPVPQGASDTERIAVIKKRAESKGQLLHFARNLFEPADVPVGTASQPDGVNTVPQLSSEASNKVETDDEDEVDPDFLDHSSSADTGTSGETDTDGGSGDGERSEQLLIDDDERARLLQRLANGLREVVDDVRHEEELARMFAVPLGVSVSTGDDSRDVRVISQPYLTWRERLGEKAYAHRKIIGATAALLLAAAAFTAWRASDEDRVERTQPTSTSTTISPTPPKTLPTSTNPPTTTPPQNGQSTNPNSTIPPITEKEEIEMKINTYLAEREPRDYPWDVVVDVAHAEGLNTSVATPTILEAVEEYNIAATAEGRDTIIVHPLPQNRFWLSLGGKSDTVTVINALRSQIAANIAISN